MLRTLKGFIARFWEDETSQVAKTTVMSIGSVLAVLAVAALPQSLLASGYCSLCDAPNCNPDTCAVWCNCQIEPCTVYYMECTGGSHYYLKVCYEVPSCGNGCTFGCQY